MEAASLTSSLGGRWHGGYGTAPCPCCQPERRSGQNALTLADGCDGRLLANCKKRGCAFADILAATGLRSGDYSPPDAATLAQRERKAKVEAQRKANQAKRLWLEAQPIEGTAAETYLRGRDITCPLPRNLRFHPECWHGPTAKRYPALVARIDGTKTFAIHRTFLDPDGIGQAILDGGNKLMLGSTAGGAVRLTQAQGPLVVAEGIETALSLASGLLRAPATVWATLSTSGMRGLRLPPTPGRLTIATDGDNAGRAAGYDLAERAYATGWEISLLPAPHGKDWNDLLIGKAVMA